MLPPCPIETAWSLSQQATPDFTPHVVGLRTAGTDGQGVSFFATSSPSAQEDQSSKYLVLSCLKSFYSLPCCRGSILCLCYKCKNTEVQGPEQ